VGVSRFVLVGIMRILQGRVSLKSLSGPITIYEVAGEEGRKGADYFVWLMAFISINLGLLISYLYRCWTRAPDVLRHRGGAAPPLPLRVREVRTSSAWRFCSP